MYVLFFVLFEVVDEQAEIFVKRRLRLRLKLKNMLCFIKKLFSELYKWKIVEHIPHHFLICKCKFRVYPVLVFLFFFGRQGLPELNSFFIAAFDNIERKLYVPDPKLGVFFYVIENADVVFCQVSGLYIRNDGEGFYIFNRKLAFDFKSPDAFYNIPKKLNTVGQIV
ncbi:hypothetical protein D3C87_1358440 [compost metagenome]